MITFYFWVYLGPAFHEKKNRRAWRKRSFSLRSMSIRFCWSLTTACISLSSSSSCLSACRGVEAEAPHSMGPLTCCWQSKAKGKMGVHKCPFRGNRWVSLVDEKKNHQVNQESPSIFRPNIPKRKLKCCFWEGTLFRLAQTEANRISASFGWSDFDRYPSSPKRGRWFLRPKWFRSGLGYIKRSLCPR